MECLMCLELNQNVVDCIQINSSTWKELNIESVIEKHLWPMIMFKTESQWLCLSCWHILHEFHKFYIRTESIHMDYEYLMKREFRKGYSKSNNIVSAEILLEPEIVLEQTKTFVKTEHNESQADYDQDDYNDDDNIPLIQMRKSIDTPTEKLNMDSESSLNDPLTKITKRTKKLRKCKTKNTIRKNTALTTSTAEIQQVNKKEENCVIKSEPDTSSSHAKVTAACPLIISADEVATPRYYYQSKLSIEQYDQFIADHFKLNCSICHKKSFVSFSELQSHFEERHQKRGYVICCETKYRDRGFLVDHINCHLNPEYFKCEFCPKVFTLRKNFKIHMRTHKNPHSCDICDKTFMSKYLVNKHKLTHVSEEEKKFPCTMCDKFFAAECLLSSHQKVVHLKTYAKLCDICGQSMPNIEAFKRHMKRHAGVVEPSVSCDICGRLVSSKDSLRIHKKTIHPVDGAREYICQICLRVSSNEKALKEHIRRNHKTGYIHKCTICEKAFKRLDHLKAHVTTHTGTDMAKCPWCPRTFNANSSMHNHRKKAHPKEWEEARIKKYSGKTPPNFKPPPANESNESNIPMEFDL